MKKYMLTFFLLLFVAGTAFAQIDRTKVPAPSPAKPIQLAEYQSFTLKNGLKVFVIENHKIPKVSVSIEVDADPVLEKDKAGMKAIFGDLLSAGTKSRSKQQLDEEIDFIGATLASSSDGIYGSSLSKYTNTLAALMSDVLLNPSFPADELDKLKTQLISSLESQKDEPASISANVASVLNFGKDHPYGEIKTPETVSKVTVEDCKNYYKKYILPNNSYVAIVGDITLADAKVLANKYFGKWKKGTVIKNKYPVPATPKGGEIALVNRPQSVQSLIRITYPVNLKPYDAEEVKVDVMNNILGGGFSARLMQNLREKHGYTYGVGSRVFSDKVAGRFTTNASVRNEVTDSALIQFRYELDRIISDTVSMTELNAAKASIIGEFARSLEDPQTIAGFAISTNKYGLAPDYFKNYLKSVEAVTQQDVLQAAKKYITPDNANVIIVGKSDDIAAKLAAFGTVKYYDIYGNEVVPKEKSALPEGLNGDAVIEKYITSLGGREKLNAITSMSWDINGDAAGQSLTGRQLFLSPDKYLVELGMGGMTISKVVSDGKKVQSVQMGAPVPASAENLKEELLMNHPFPELLYKEMGVSATLKGTDNVDGKDVYIVEVKKPDGGVSIHYFDAATGFKLRQEDSMETPMGNMTISTDYLDYTTVDGVTMSMTSKQKIGPQVITLKSQNVSVNKGLDEALFNVK